MKYIALLSLLLLFSCQSSFLEDELLFQALGREGEIVIVTDSDHLSSLLPESGFSEIIERTERATILITAEDDGYFFSGALEGSFPRIALNYALKHSSSFSKDGDFYKSADGNLEIYIPKNGIVFFSQKSVGTIKDRLMDNRVTYIDDESASLIENSSFSLYSLTPERLSFSFIDINEEKIELIFVREEGQNFSGLIRATDESSAEAILRGLRNEAIKRTRVKGEGIDVSLLSSYFIKQGKDIILSFPLTLFGGLNAFI